MSASTALLDDLDTWLHFSQKTRRWYIAPAAWILTDKATAKYEIRRRYLSTELADTARPQAAELLEALKARCVERADIALQEPSTGASNPGWAHDK